MALGGQPGDVLRLIVGQGMTVVATGVALGLLAAFFLARVMSGLLFRTGSGDALTFTAVAFLLLAAALVACVVPAKGATDVHPATVLRHE
jgi:putative ABC transport system permease protein